MKIEDYQKARAVLEGAKNAKNFYEYIISKVQRGKCEHIPKPDTFECGKVLDFVLEYLEVEKKMAMEKAEKMIGEI